MCAGPVTVRHWRCEHGHIAETVARCTACGAQGLLLAGELGHLHGA